MSAADQDERKIGYSVLSSAWLSAVAWGPLAHLTCDQHVVPGTINRARVANALMQEENLPFGDVNLT